MLNFVDSHCHLSSKDYENEQADIVKRASDMGITRIVTIGTRLEDAPELIKITKKYPNIFATIGVHPEYVSEKEVSAEQIISVAKSDEKIIAIGEAGFDLHYDPETVEAQAKLFRNHLIAADKLNLPISIHTRSAENETIEILSDFPSVRGVLHCFSSNQKLAEFGMEQGLYFSASGIITFKKADELRHIFSKIPLDKLLLETDAPFLAPTPYRGKRNEPSMMIKTAEILAEIKGVSLQKISDITTENFLNLFTKAK